MPNVEMTNLYQCCHRMLNKDAKCLDDKFI